METAVFSSENIASVANMAVAVVILILVALAIQRLLIQSCPPHTWCAHA